MLQFLLQLLLAEELISPLAKKMASEKIDISTVKGSGDNGRIVKRY